MSGFDYEEFLHILIGVPPEFKIGDITTVTHEVMCFAGSNIEQVTSLDDDVKVFDADNNDVTNYAWWANPGKYTIKVVSYSLCPTIGSDKAPTSLGYIASPLPPENIVTYDYDFLKTALDNGRPALIKAKDQTFTNRSEPHNVGVVSLRLTNLNAPSNIDTDPELFQSHAPTGISTFQISVDNAPTAIISNELLGQNSSPTGIQEYEGLTNVHSPTSLIAYTASSVQPHNANVLNLDFSRHPNAIPTTANVIELKLKVGPEAIVAVPYLTSNSVPGAISAIASPFSSSSVTGLGTTILQAQHTPTSLQVMASPSEAVTSLESTAPPNANSSPTGLQTSSISPYANGAPTGMSYLVDMDGDTVYSDVDIDDNDPSVGLLAPPDSSHKPSNLQVSDVDMDGDNVYASTDYDDNDPSVQTTPEWGIGLTRIAFTAPMFPDTSIDGGSTWIIGNPNLIGTTKTTYGNPILLRANPETYTSLASFSSGRPTWYFQGWTKATAGNELNEISYDPYDPNTEVTHNIGYGNGYGSLVANFQTDKTPIFVYYTKFQMSNKIVSSDTATLETAEGSVQILPYMHPGYQYLNSNAPISESSQTPGATGYTGKDSWVTLTVPTSISSTTGSNQGTFTFHSLYNASNSGSWVANETKNGNSVKFTAAFASMNAPIVYFARYQ